MSQLAQVKQAKSFHRASILLMPNVVGLGVGYKVTQGVVTDELSVVVLVRQKVPSSILPSENIVPQELNSVRTDVFQVGEIRPLLARSDRWRPAPGGVSMGHYQITTGTFGAVVRDRKSGVRLILSNNHVLANSNQALIGDPILQPGRVDGGQLGKDTIARLERFSPIRFNSEPPTCSLVQTYVQLGNSLARMLRSHHQFQAFREQPDATNKVDAALALPLEDSAILDEILDIGSVNATSEPDLGMAVRKSGRTTDFTTGSVSILDATVVVNYGYDRVATFENQVLTTPMSRGGDSGALLVEKESPRAVGLLFAGSDQTTIFNPIQAVLETLDIEFFTPQAKAKGGRPAAVEKAIAVKEAYQDFLMSKPNVVGVGVGLRHKEGKRTDEVGLVVMVRRKLPDTLLAPDDIIPSEIDGVPVDVKEVGDLEVY